MESNGSTGNNELSIAIDDSQTQVIAPGFVYLKQCLSRDQQIWLANYALTTCGPEEKDHRKSFWVLNKNTGHHELNLSMAGRGRVYNALDNFKQGDRLKDFALSLSEMARKHNENLPEMTPTHMILLLYGTNKGMGWHADDDKNDGDNNHPIVSISLGNQATFGYMLDEVEHSLLLKSGDVLVWGGPSRMLRHTVKEVKRRTGPSYLPKDLHNARICFTLRDTPTMFGQEQLYQFAYGDD